MAIELDKALVTYEASPAHEELTLCLWPVQLGTGDWAVTVRRTEATELYQIITPLLPADTPLGLNVKMPDGRDAAVLLALARWHAETGHGMVCQRLAAFVHQSMLRLLQRYLMGLGKLCVEALGPHKLQGLYAATPQGNRVQVISKEFHLELRVDVIDASLAYTLSRPGGRSPKEVNSLAEVIALLSDLQAVEALVVN